MLPVHIAAEQGHVHVVRYLCCFVDVNVGTCDEYKFTPLHKATYLDALKLFNIFAKSIPKQLKQQLRTATCLSILQLC